MVLSSITAVEKQRQQVPFGLFQVCTGRPRGSSRSVNSRDYRQRLCRTLIDRAIMKKSCFPWEDALCAITLSGSGGHLMGLSGFLTAQRIRSGGDSGRVIVSNIVNQWPLAVSLFLPWPSSWNTLDNPKSDSQYQRAVTYFPELFLEFGGENVQIRLIVLLLPAGLAVSPPPSHLLKTTQTPTSVVSFLHLCFSPFGEVWAKQNKQFIWPKVV